MVRVSLVQEKQLITRTFRWGNNLSFRQAAPPGHFCRFLGIMLPLQNWMNSPFWRGMMQFGVIPPMKPNYITRSGSDRGQIGPLQKVGH